MPPPGLHLSGLPALPRSTLPLPLPGIFPTELPLVSSTLSSVVLEATPGLPWLPGGLKVSTLQPRPSRKQHPGKALCEPKPLGKKGWRITLRLLCAHHNIHSMTFGQLESRLGFSHWSHHIPSSVDNDVLTPVHHNGMRVCLSKIEKSEYHQQVIQKKEKEGKITVALQGV